MSAPAQVTEAHRELAYAILFAEDGHAGPNETAQLIADSQARATAEVRAELTDQAARFHDEIARRQEVVRANKALDLKERDQLRAVFPKILAALGNGACCAPDVSVEFINAIPNEVAGVVAGLRADLDAIKAILTEEKARAERAEAELAPFKDTSKGIGGYIDSLMHAKLDAEAELAGIRALADRRNERDHSQDTTHQLVAALDQALDIAQAELKAEQDNSAINEIELKVSRAIVSKIWVQLGSPTYEQLKGRSIYDLIDELKAELAKERARLDWLLNNIKVSHTAGK